MNLLLEKLLDSFKTYSITSSNLLLTLTPVKLAQSPLSKLTSLFVGILSTLPKTELKETPLPSKLSMLKSLTKKNSEILLKPTEIKLLKNSKSKPLDGTPMLLLMKT